MKHISALVLKVLLVGAILYLILPRYGVTSSGLLLTNVATVVISAYIIGDLIILPTTNNVIASIADGGLAAAVVWFVNNRGGQAFISTSGLLLTGVAIAVGEYFFHMYLIRTETVHMRMRSKPDANPEQQE